MFFSSGPQLSGHRLPYLRSASLALGLIALAVGLATFWLAVVSPWTRSPETFHATFSPRRDAVQYASFGDRQAVVVDPVSDQLQVRQAPASSSGSFAPLKRITTGTPGTQPDPASNQTGPSR